MYLVRYYDGIWHDRHVRSKERAYALFEEQKAVGAKRVEVYYLDRLFNFWNDVVCADIFRDIVKRGMNEVYGATAAGDVHEIHTEGEGDNDHACAD